MVLWIAGTMALAILIGSLLFRPRSKQFYGLLREYGFRVMPLFGLGVFIASQLIRRWPQMKGARMQDAVTDLYGKQYSQAMMLIHLAQKVVFAMILILADTFMIGFSSNPAAAAVYGAASLALVLYMADRGLYEQVEKRKRQMLLDLPGILNTLVLLLEAGLPLLNALRKTVTEQGSQRPLQIELARVIAEINSGKSIQKSFEDLARRCRMPEITRFVSIIILNLHRGNDDLSTACMNLAHESWIKRKELVKRLGEEAATKLVFPMVMIFLAIGIIVLAPALMAF